MIIIELKKKRSKGWLDIPQQWLDNISWMQISLDFDSNSILIKLMW